MAKKKQKEAVEFKSAEDVQKVVDLIEGEFHGEDSDGFLFVKADGNVLRVRVGTLVEVDNGEVKSTKIEAPVEVVESEEVVE